MIRAFLLALGQLGDARVLAVFAKATTLTLAIFAVLGVALWQGAEAIARAYAFQTGPFAALGATLLALVLGWLLFRVVAIAVMGLFADGVVAAVEARHYPETLGEVREPSLALSLRLGLASVWRALLFNLLALPLYMILLVTGVGSVLLFGAVNALLLGRDLGEMVAIRHMPKEEVKSWLERTRGWRLALGAIVTVLLSVPIVNLLAPVLGAAMAAHLFHSGRVSAGLRPSA